MNRYQCLSISLTAFALLMGRMAGEQEQPPVGHAPRPVNDMGFKIFDLGFDGDLNERGRGVMYFEDEDGAHALIWDGNNWVEPLPDLPNLETGE